jgi:hypothetical protein
MSEKTIEELESEIECLRKEVSYCERMMVWRRDFVFWSAKRSVCLDKIETIEAEIRRRGK